MPYRWYSWTCDGTAAVVVTLLSAVTLIVVLFGAEPGGPEGGRPLEWGQVVDPEMVADVSEPATEETTAVASTGTSEHQSPPEPPPAPPATEHAQPETPRDDEGSVEPASKATSDDSPASAAPRVTPEITALTSAQKRDEIEAHEIRLHAGQVQVLLDVSGLSVDDLAPLLAVYSVRDEHQQFLLDGQGQILAVVPVSSTLLACDLRPSQLSTAVREAIEFRLGHFPRTRITALLTDEVTLQVLRTLAQHLADPEPGTRVELRLSLDVARHLIVTHVQTTTDR